MKNERTYTKTELNKKRKNWLFVVILAFSIGFLGGGFIEGKHKLHNIETDAFRGFSYRVITPQYYTDEESRQLDESAAEYEEYLMHQQEGYASAVS